MTTAASLVFDQLVGVTGSMDIGSGGVASLLAGSGSGLVADFLPSLGTLLLGNPLSFTGTIAGFAAGDTIELTNTPETKFSYAGNVPAVTNGRTPKAQLHFDGSYTTSSFNVAQDAHGNAIITHT